MKSKFGGQHMQRCVSVNSDTVVFVYMSACEGCFSISVYRSGSCVGHSN